MSTSDGPFDGAAELDRIADEVPTAQQVPFLESVVERADAAGDEPLAARARSELMMQGLYYSDRPSVEYLAPFVWLVSRFDQQPSWWTTELQHTVLWTYKWIIGVALDDPAIALPVIDDLIDGMAERYARHGEGETPVLERRYRLERTVHGPLAADDLFVAWAAAPRTEYSDCHVCEPDTKMAHLVRVGRDEEALSHYWPVLAENHRCGTQPEGIHAEAIVPLLRTGKAEQAATAHLAGSRASRTEPNQTGNIGRHVRVLALAGQPARALELFEERVAALLRPASPYEQMWFAASGALLMRRLVFVGYADLPVLDPDGVRVAAGDLGSRLEAMALDLASAFDGRNQTTTASRQIQDLLDAEDLPPLPLGASARSLPGLAPSAGGPSQVTEPLVRPRRGGDTPPENVADLRRYADSGWREGDEDRLKAAVERWTQVGAQAWSESVDATGGVGDLDLLDALLTMDAHLLRAPDQTSAEDRHEAVRRSAWAARAGGFEADALLVEQAGAMHEVPLAVEADAAEAHIEELLTRVRGAVQTIDTAIEDGSPVLGGAVAEMRARARGRAAAMASDHAAALRWANEGLELLSDVDADSRDEVRWTRSTLLRLRAQLAEGPEALVADLHEVLRLLHDGLLPDHRAGALTHLSAVHAHEDRWDEAMLQLREAFALAAGLHADGPANEVIRATTQLMVGAPVDPNTVVDLLEQQLEYTASTGDLVACAALRSDLSLVHLEASHDVEAAEVAEVGLTDLERRDDTPHDYLDVNMITGSLAFTAARASAALGELDRALRATLTAETAYLQAGQAGLAARAVSLTGHLHRQQDNTTESLAAYQRCATLLDPDLSQGDYSMLDVAAFARRCAGSLTRPVDGGPAASVVFDQAQAFLSQIEGRLLDGALTPDPSAPPPESVRALVAWEQVSIEMDRAAMVAADGRAGEALDLLEGLDGRFVALNEYADAIGVMIGRGSLQAELGRGEAAEETWTAAIREAQSHQLPHLQEQVASRWAIWLDEQGRSDEAGQVWETWGTTSDD